MVESSRTSSGPQPGCPAAALGRWQKDRRSPGRRHARETVRSWGPRARRSGCLPYSGTLPSATVPIAVGVDESLDRAAPDEPDGLPFLVVESDGITDTADYTHTQASLRRGLCTRGRHPRGTGASSPLPAAAAAHPASGACPARNSRWRGPGLPLALEDRREIVAGEAIPQAFAVTVVAGYLLGNVPEPVPEV
jgi:hypothetical protein